MIIKTEEEYRKLCAEYELLKDEDKDLDRKVELAEALWKYEERGEPEDIKDARESWEQGINGDLRSLL